ncbi:unnamed protein product [Ambrosiozyma monospora]|uniref:Unnamed protein product n=1 Tax=Ambrosiozyma monospora TaxID=43982 RepID=A0ACB5TAH6_AMBMO|nr:unnamed protein product [Ambrosiozyma monospora]
MQGWEIINRLVKAAPAATTDDLATFTSNLPATCPCPCPFPAGPPPRRLGGLGSVPMPAVLEFELIDVAIDCCEVIETLDPVELADDEADDETAGAVVVCAVTVPVGGTGAADDVDVEVEGFSGFDVVEDVFELVGFKR